jgi:hypothetical protein
VGKRGEQVSGIQRERSIRDTPQQLGVQYAWCTSPTCGLMHIHRLSYRLQGLALLEPEDAKRNHIRLPRIPRIISETRVVPSPIEVLAPKLGD